MVVLLVVVVRDGSMDRTIDSWITLGWAYFAVLWRNVPQSAKLDMIDSVFDTAASPPSRLPPPELGLIIYVLIHNDICAM